MRTTRRRQCWRQAKVELMVEKKRNKNRLKVNKIKQTINFNSHLKLLNTMKVNHWFTSTLIYYRA